MTQLKGHVSYIADRWPQTGSVNLVKGGCKPAPGDLAG
jgi:hypothetical protein